MERATARNLYLIALVLVIIGGVVAGIGAASALSAAQSATDSTAASTAFAGGGILSLIALLVLLVGSVLFTIAWIGSLIKLAKLNQWTWFILMLLFSGITMLIYIFAGPTEAKAA